MPGCSLGSTHRLSFAVARPAQPVPIRSNVEVLPCVRMASRAVGLCSLQSGPTEPTSRPVCGLIDNLEVLDLDAAPMSAGRPAVTAEVRVVAGVVDRLVRQERATEMALHDEPVQVGHPALDGDLDVAVACPPTSDQQAAVCRPLRFPESSGHHVVGTLASHGHRSASDAMLGSTVHQTSACRARLLRGWHTLMVQVEV